MQTSSTPVWARDHTLLGVCEALGEDLGFNPVLLRIPFAALLLLSPTLVIATYAALGVLVAASRLLIPNPKRPAEAAPAAAEAEEREAEMALAA